MKATELMIGDWILSPMSHPYKVYELTQDFAYFDNSEGEMADIMPKVGIKYYALTPIILTADILEKNGIKFQFGKVWYQVHNDRIQLVWEHDSSSIRICIDYVHELQHALRLCGLNDLADNFKI